MTYPVPNFTPYFPMTDKMTSFAVTPFGAFRQRGFQAFSAAAATMSEWKEHVPPHLCRYRRQALRMHRESMYGCLRKRSFSRKCQTKLRPDYVNDPLVCAVKIRKTDAKLLTIPFKRGYLALCDFIFNVKTVDGRNIVVHRRECILRPSDLSPLLS